MLVAAYGKVFLVRKVCGHDQGTLYAMKVLKKASIITKPKTTEHTMTERQVSSGIFLLLLMPFFHFFAQNLSSLYEMLCKFSSKLKLLRFLAGFGSCQAISIPRHVALRISNQF